jgi:NADPH:quinone reductase-like Zn-dependent oxidoreductase
VFKAMLDPDKRKDFKIPKKPDVLEVFRSLLETKKLTPVIGRTFALSEVAAAMRCMQEGHLGRMIIRP